MNHFKSDSTLIQRSMNDLTNSNKNELHHPTKASKDIPEGLDTNQRKKSKLRRT